MDNQFKSKADFSAEADTLLDLVPDIGNALAGVLSATQALRNGAASDPAFRGDLLGEMEDSLHLLRSLYENWIVSGSVLSGRIALIPRQVEPTPWLSGVLSSWPQREPDKHLRWEIAVRPDHPAIRLDQDLVELALENLLAGSIAAAPDRSGLLVASGFAAEGPGLWIEISDQGQALTGQALSGVIDGVRPPEADGPRFDEGRFIGLRVADAVARLHGGSLAVVGRSGFACTLRLSLAVSTPSFPDPSGG